MKRNFLFMSVLASLFMAGCSQEEIIPSNEDDGNGKANTSYMAVKLVSSDVGGTRAQSGFEDGTEKENKVSSVRFYFFTANGLAANVKLNGTSYVNYYDLPADSIIQNQGSLDTDDIESKLTATIAISTKEGDKLPQKVAVVINVNNLDNNPKSLDDLKAIYADYVGNNNSLVTSGKFVMFNSVYGNTQKTAEVCAVPIESDHLQKTPGLAKTHPVIIYVERNVAKVEVTLGNDVEAAKTDKLALKDKDGKDLKILGQQVYLKLNNWSLSAETDEGRLVKKISLDWTESWWNGTHRSYWAMNAPTATNLHHNYDSINTNIDSVLYTNENALDYIAPNNQTTELNRTKVIFKGTLCKADGTPFTIVRHAGSHFPDTYSETPANNLLELKKNIISQLTANGKYYYSGNQTTRTLITPQDLQIVIVDQTESEPSDGKARNCYVYAQLTTAAQAKTWYTSSDNTVTTTVSSTIINNDLANKDVVDRALVWKSGMTYYYYEIIHQGTGNNATKGVVRNHIYKTKVTKIAGLGTPVYDPEQVIYPEKPDPNDHYIAAQINILSWRIANSTYELEW